MNLKTLLTPRSNTSDEVYAQATDAGDALVAAGMAPYEEITRQGYAFHVKSTTATVSVVALPTTSCAIGFYNSAADGGKSAVIDAIFAVAAVGTTTLGQFGMIYCVGQNRTTALTNAFVVRKNNGNGPAVGNVLLAATGGAVLSGDPGAAIHWMPIGPSANMTVVSLLGVVLFADVGGRIIVPPGRQFGVNIMSSNTAHTFNMGIMWHEKVLKLG